MRSVHCVNPKPKSQKRKGLDHHVLIICYDVSGHSISVTTLADNEPEEQTMMKRGVVGTPAFIVYHASEK